jgi:hypothetical protein
MAPDRRMHRGPHPRDSELFAERHHAVLCRAVDEFSWLLSRDYSTDATLKLVGDRYALKARQRLAVMRCGCSDQAVRHAGNSSITDEQCAGHPIGIDGHNLLITVESALSGGLVLIGRDGHYRDLASVHGNYRTVQETNKALELILDQVERLRPHRVDFYLDRPVSNSGRLKTRLASLLDSRTCGDAPHWNIELAPSPDRILRDYDGIVATTDRAVLACCDRTLNLAGTIIGERLRKAWVLDLRQLPPGGCGDGGTRL